jgi:hypothetical protein
MKRLTSSAALYKGYIPTDKSLADTFHLGMPKRTLYQLSET